MTQAEHSQTVEGRPGVGRPISAVLDLADDELVVWRYKREVDDAWLYEEDRYALNEWNDGTEPEQVPALDEPKDDREEGRPENGVLLHRLDTWTDDVNPGPLIRWAAAHVRGCAATPDPTLLAKAIYAADLVEPVTFSVKTVDSEAERIAVEYARLSGDEGEAG